MSAPRMKTTVWVLSTCIPEDGKPCHPHVFATREEALAQFEADMRSEWSYIEPRDEIGARLDYPDGDPEKAHELIDGYQTRIENGFPGTSGEIWGRYSLTSHEIEVEI